MFTRIPDTENDRQSAHKSFGKRVLATLELGSSHIYLRDDFLRLNAPQEARKSDQLCKELSKKVRYYFDELAQVTQLEENSGDFRRYFRGKS
jgi:hypothetical protein